MKRRSYVKSGSLLSAVLVFQALTLFTPTVRADDFDWSGDCGTSNWYTTCVTDLCSGDERWTYNNWGRVGCGSVVFPGTSDSVSLSGDSVFLYGEADIDTLDVGVGGLLTIDNAGHELSAYSGITNVGQLTVINGGKLSASNISIVNDGTLTVQYGGYYGGGFLSCAGDVLLTGSGSLVFNTTGYIQGAGTLTVDASQTIHGYGGTISNLLVNDGTLDADVSVGWLRLDSQPKTNNGLMQATAGGYLDLYTAIDQTGGGEMRADGTSSRVRFYNGTSVIGGTLTTAYGGQFNANHQTATLSNLTNTGTVRFENGATLNVTGTTLTNDGEISLYYGGTYGGSHIYVSSGLTWQGAGSIYFDTGDLDSSDPNGFTHAAGHTIHGGNGTIRAAIINRGLINADRAALALDLREKAKMNDGVIKSTGGGYVDVRTVITQTAAGEIRAEGSSSRVRLYDGASIVGGTLSTSDGGRFNANHQTATLSDLTNAGTVRFENGATLNVAGTTLTNNGNIGIYYGGTYGGSRLRFSSDVAIGGSGDVYIETGDVSTDTGITITQSAGHEFHGRGSLNVAMLNEGSIVADWSGQTLTINAQAPGVTQAGLLETLAGCPLTLNNATLFTQTGGQTIVGGTLTVNGGQLSLDGGVLTGSGTISGSVVNTGATIEPGASAGTLTVNGSYAQAAGGTLRIELGGTSPGEYDKFAVTGAVSLGGTLYVEPIDGFVPEVGQQFTIMTFASRTGEFAALSGSCEYSVTYNATTVTLTVLSAPLLGDLNCDSQVDGLDIGPFVLVLMSTPPDYPEYYTQHPYCDHTLADCNDDGETDIADLQPFMDLLLDE
ncbi:MAG: hypothetical protein JXQ75_08775 [Phycisphaerae bacterium]|nr:hypothetical protein [Phycisphaerae bacterium]